MRERVRCPTCRTEAAWKDNPWRPFCSERCRMIDLGAWLSERYRIPGEPAGQASTAEGDRNESEGEAAGPPRGELGRRSC